MLIANVSGRINSSFSQPLTWPLLRRTTTPHRTRPAAHSTAQQVHILITKVKGPRPQLGVSLTCKELRRLGFTISHRKRVSSGVTSLFNWPKQFPLLFLRGTSSVLLTARQEVQSLEQQRRQALWSPVWSQHYSKKVQTKADSSALNQISCILKRQLSEHLLTQSSQPKGVLQVVFPIINSHINIGEAWIWHLDVVLSLEWVRSFTIQRKDGIVWKQETNET